MTLKKAFHLSGRSLSFILLAFALAAGFLGDRFYEPSKARPTFVDAPGDKDKDKKNKKKKSESGPATTTTGSGKSFQGGLVEASGVAYVPGTDGVLILDDGRSNEILWMRLDPEGNQAGPLKPIPLGVAVDDPEGITFDGAYFYIVGSQSKTKEEEVNSLIRFRFDPERQTISNLESARGLYNFLTSTIPDLKEYAGKKGKKETINIEGLAWDPIQNRLLLGLRDPQIADQAMIIALKLRDPNGRLSIENLVPAQPNAIRISLDGDAIRSLEYNPSAKRFEIISGAPETKKKTDFKLWEWDGSSAPRQKTILDSSLKPEGLTRIVMDGKDFTFIVCDASAYFKLN
jgi:uncharacterized protein YjiK